MVYLEMMGTHDVIEQSGKIGAERMSESEVGW